MKNTLKGLAVVVVLLSVMAPSVLASNPNRNEIRNTIKENFKEERKEASNTAVDEDGAREIKNGLLEKVKNFVKNNLKFEARVKGKITIIGTNDFSIDGEDGVFKINITDKTKILRKFGGKSSFSELSVGDELMVFGKFTDDTKTTIDAKTIKNNSIQKRFGAFFGKVTIKNIDNFVMETEERGIQTVYFGNAKFVQRNETAMIYTDLKVGDRVRVKGVWDKTLSKIAEVIQIKDFSIPVVTPTKTPED